jgi:CPA1 family monovalent cation:H+ antiporter
MVLLIPDTFTVPGWSLAYTPKEFILALTVSCVFATLFIKATTIGKLMNRLELNTLTKLEEINYRETLLHIYTSALKRLKEISTKGYVREETYAMIHTAQLARIQETLKELEERSSDPQMLEKVIRLHAIGIERKYVRELFAAEEITESIIRKITAKLEYQSHAIEHDRFSVVDCEHARSIDVFEYLAELFGRFFQKKPTLEEEAAGNYLYYRALSIISRKVIKELTHLHASFDESFIAPHAAIQNTIDLYERYRSGSSAKMEEIRSAYHEHIQAVEARLAYKALYTNESKILHRFFEREMVTPKVSISLGERLLSESKKGLDS